MPGGGGAMISLNVEGGGSSGESVFEREVAGIFSPTGLLSGAASFEFREEQQRMAREVAGALDTGSSLAIEAGTGVGKSLAYLIPCALHAKATRRKAVISTHTIALQEQLIHKDIPLVQKLLPVEFDAVLLKGRHNFLCGTRLDRALASSGDLFLPEERKELERLREWSLTTRDGSLTDFIEQPAPRVWEEVRSEPGICSPKVCGAHPRCFYQALRRRVLGADMVVLNHALFFTLAGALDVEHQKRGILFADDFVVFDEAHTIEDVASRHIGMDISEVGVRRGLLRLFNPKTGKGLLQALGDGPSCAAVSGILPLADAFFGEIIQNCHFGKGRVQRILEPGLADASALSDALTRMNERLAILSAKLEEDPRRAELQEASARLRAIRSGVLDFVGIESPEQVYWVEQAGKGNHCLLKSAPVDLADTLRTLLFREGSTCVLTSATLSVGSDNLSYFRNRIGAEAVRASRIGSPFDYEKQMHLHLVRQMPEPKSPDYIPALGRWIAKFTAQTDGHAFALFTSHQTMRSVAEILEPEFSKTGWPLLVQGTGKPAHRMLQEFRENPRSVLFGVDSFWAGVDIPGSALTNVIITRLPFATPDHPLTQARFEQIESAGERPFEKYSLPEAILKLRQGVGRLIRTKSDQGIIVILDSRILSKAYGRAFLNALPKCLTTIH